jgi:hypothetical protein
VQIKQSPEKGKSLDESQTVKESNSHKGDKVSISEEGLYKQASEVEGTDKKENGNPVIEMLKKQIDAIKKQLQELEGSDSPKAEEQRKILSEQLGVLNASLLSAINKDAEKMNKGSS